MGTLRIRLVSSLAIVTLATLAGRPAEAGTQTILGEKLLVKGAADGSGQRKVFVSASVTPSAGAKLVGDPTASGATLRLITRSPSRSYDRTIELPKDGWSVAPGIRPEDGKSYQFRSDRDGAIWFVWIGTTSSTTPGTPGPFKIKIKLYDDPSVDVLAPDPGTEGGVVLTLGGGDRYCVAFGGAAGGVIEANHAKTFAVRAPTAKGCPDVPSAVRITPSPTPRPAATGPG